MKCIICGGDTFVSNSRPAKEGSAVWRRRECGDCGTVFSSRERPDLSLSIKVKKDQEILEAFSEEKLLLSVYESLSHRKDRLRASKELTLTIVKQLLPVRSGVVSAKEIAELAYKAIERFDKAAATFYTAHHKL